MVRFLFEKEESRWTREFADVSQINSPLSRRLVCVSVAKVVVVGLVAVQSCLDVGGHLFVLVVSQRYWLGRFTSK